MSRALRLAETRSVLHLAWPTIFENLMTTMVSYVDTAMVGSLGALATAAVAINSSPMWMINSTISAVAVGGTVLVAQAIGAQEPERASDVSRQCLSLSLAFGLLFCALGVCLGPFIPVWMGAQSDVIPLAMNYIRIVALGFIPHFMGLVMSAVLRGAGDMRTPMIVNLITNVLNIIGNFLLIFPTRPVSLFGLTFTMWGAGLGVAGAAASTAFATATSGVLILLAFLRPKRRMRQLTLKGSYRPRPDILRKVFKVGLPAALERLSISIGQIFYLRLVSGLGTISLAAHHLAVNAESISYMPATGFQTAATTLVGQSMGAQEPDKAKRYGNITFALGTAVMCVAGLVLFLLPRQLMGIFTQDAAVIDAGASALRIVAFSEPFFGASIILSGALRGGGDTRWPFLISLAAMWGVRLGSAWVFAYGLGWGLNGAWLGMALDLIVRGVWMIVRFERGKWKQMRI
ncbi:MAG: MATE family efflux transporter [Christensenellales bacterium]